MRKAINIVKTGANVKIAFFNLLFRDLLILSFYPNFNIISPLLFNFRGSNP